MTTEHEPLESYDPPGEWSVDGLLQWLKLVERPAPPLPKDETGDKIGQNPCV